MKLAKTINDPQTGSVEIEKYPEVPTCPETGRASFSEIEIKILTALLRKTPKTTHCKFCSGWHLRSK